MIGFPAGVLQVQGCEQDLNVPQFVLLNFSQSRQCNQRPRTIAFVSNFGSVSVFVFAVKEAFDLPCFPRDYKDEKLKLVNLVSLAIKVFRFYRKKGAW